MSAAEQLDIAVTAEATDAEFAAFLAARPQITRADMAPTPGLCTCSGRYTIGDKPILIRHTSCDNGPAGSVSFIDGQVMHTSTLPALAEWIPVPPPPPELDMAVAAIIIRHMIDNLALHLVKLHPGTKKPMGNRWNDPAVHPALTADEAIAHHAAGGGLGVLLGPSRLIILDAENYAAVQALRDAGLRPVLYTAKGINTDVCVDPRTDKRGGGHFWLRYDQDFDRARLDNVPAAKIGNGGVVDVLAMPGCMAVVPPTALVEAGMWCYTADGAHPVWDAAHPVVDVPPEWLLDPAAACPAGLEALHASQGPKVRKAHEPVTEAQAELSSEIDAVPWAEIFALDDRIELWGDVDSECGDVEIHWRGADHRKSGVAHECERGTYIHVFSASMCAALGIDSAEATLSKMQLACRLQGRATTGADFRAVAEHFGIDLGGRFSFADDLDRAADKFEEHADDETKCTGELWPMPDPAEVPQLVAHTVQDGKGGTRTVTRRTTGRQWLGHRADRDHWLLQATKCRETARMLRAGQSAAGVRPAGGETELTDPVLGAPAPSDTAAPLPDPAPDAATGSPDPTEPIDAEIVDESPVAPTSTTSALAVDDAVEGELVMDWEDGDQQMWKRIREIEAELRGERDPKTKLWAGMTPGLGRIANIAERDGVYYHGVIEAVLARISARVPANVLIEPRNGNRENKIAGLSLSYNVLVFGAPATAKTTSMSTAESAVPFPPGIAVKPSGTAEGLVKAARRKVGGGHGHLPEQKIVATSVFGCTDEIGTVKSELKRDASKYIYHVNSAYFGNSVLGQTASEDSRDVTIPPHGVRMSQLFGAQPQLCSELWEHAGSGFDARWAAAFAGSHAKEDLGPLFGKPVPALLPNGLPWDPPVGIPYGYSPAGVVEDEETGEKIMSYEADAPENLPPVWIVMPEAAKEGAEEALARSADRSRHTRRAMLHDMEANRSEGHEGVRTRKAAALLAILDGRQHPEEVHWRAAELLCEASNLAIEESIAQSEMYRDHQAKKTGRTKGLEMASGRAAAEQATSDSVAAAAEAIYGKLTRPVEGTMVRGKPAYGYGGTATIAQITAAKVIGSRHSGYIQQGFDQLVQQGRITVAAVGNDRRQWKVTAPGAITAAPPISGIAPAA